MMRSIKRGGCTTALVVCMVVGGVSPVVVAQPTACPETTGENATVVVPEDALAPGVPLAVGDVLRAYGASGRCVGEVTWEEGEGVALTLWGDDVTTPDPEGLAAGEAFSFHALRGDEEAGLSVSFAEVLAAPPGVGAEYHRDAVYLVGEIAAQSPTAGEGSLPGGFQLSEAYPNPFASTATLTLELARRQYVSVTVVDVLGRFVRQVRAELLDSGRTHRFTIEAGGLASGSYLIRIEGEHFAVTRRFTLVR